MDILTIGTATRDVFLRSPFFKVLKDPAHLKKIGFASGEAQCFALGGKIDILPPIFTTGGGATNTAVSFKRLGLKTAILTKVGKDKAGEEILGELKKEKIKSFATIDKNAHTGYSTFLLSQDGERTILVHRGASDLIQEKDISFSKIKTDWAYIAPGNIPIKTINKIVNSLYKRKINITINPSKYLLGEKISGLENILKKSKVVLMNREEAAHLTGVNYGDESEIFKKLDKAIPGIIAMTDGSRGVLVSDGEFIYSAGIFKERKIVDRTGAGDAFGSGFVAGLIKKSKIKNQKSKLQIKIQKFSKEDIKFAIRLGSANATSVIEKIGAKEGILTMKEFEKNKRWQNLKINIIRI